MNKIKDILRRAKKSIIRVGLAIGLAAAAAAPQPVRAQTGTYVVPRIATQTIWVSNNNTYTLTFTNLLNYSGWHNNQFYLSEQGTNTLGTNQVNVSVYGSPGSGSGYTNVASGLNSVYTGAALLAWNNAIVPTAGAATNYGTWTNLQQSLGDGMALYKVNITTLCSNGVGGVGFWLQVDFVATP